MSFISGIKDALSDVATIFADDATIEYEPLTSNPDANPRTYGSWVALAGARTIDYTEDQLRDPETGYWWREQTCQLRVPSNLGISFTIKDRVRVGGSTGTIYSVRSLPRSAAGSVVQYTLAVRTPMMQDPRSGGV